METVWLALVLVEHLLGAVGVALVMQYVAYANRKRLHPMFWPAVLVWPLLVVAALALLMRNWRTIRTIRDHADARNP